MGEMMATPFWMQNSRLVNSINPTGDGQLEIQADSRLERRPRLAGAGVAGLVIRRGACRGPAPRPSSYFSSRVR